MKRPWAEWTDEELANEAQEGLRGQGAVVEITRRLTVAVQKLDHATTILSRWLLVCTVALVVLTVILVLQALVA